MREQALTAPERKPLASTQPEDGADWAGKVLGANLRAAREHAGLTQVQLAEKLGKSQTLIARAESGAGRIGERYVLAVLQACGLPPDWQP